MKISNLPSVHFALCVSPRSHLAIMAFECGDEMIPFRMVSMQETISGDKQLVMNRHVV